MSASPRQPVSTRALNCSHCGAPLTIPVRRQRMTVVCIQCCSVLDAKGPVAGRCYRHSGARTHPAKIPLGKRGKLDGAEWEFHRFSGAHHHGGRRPL
jgi:hypothetical protein